jgi:hypothetical protein
MITAYGDADGTPHLPILQQLDVQVAFGRPCVNARQKLPSCYQSFRVLDRLLWIILVVLVCLHLVSLVCFVTPDHATRCGS